MDPALLNFSDSFRGIFHARFCRRKYGHPFCLFPTLRHETFIQRYGHNNFYFPGNFCNFWLLGTLEYWFCYLDNNFHHHLPSYICIYPDVYFEYREIRQNQLRRPVYYGLRRSKRWHRFFPMQTYVCSGPWKLFLFDAELYDIFTSIENIFHL